MGGKLQLSIFVLLIQVSLAVWQRVTIMKGQTLNLRCPISNAHKTHVEWKNPNGRIMFFNQKKALRDRRYSINQLSQYEFSISVSNVTFKDGGNYTCTQYDHPPVERKVEVTVIGPPRMSVTMHKGKSVIKCSAEANFSPALLSWEFDHGPEISFGQTNYLQGHKYMSESRVDVLLEDSRVTVKCLTRHPALHSPPLMNFVKVGRELKPSHHTTATAAPASSPTARPQGSTGVPGTTVSWFRPVTRRYSRPPQAFPPYSEHDSTTRWTSGNETSEDITSQNTTRRNETGSFDSDMLIGTHNKSTLLVFLVTCLIIGLLVVVIFFVIKLRRAHISWKRENEDSDPSEESSKSKSSQEEKNSQGQRRRGIFNTVFAQYVLEEPAVRTSERNAAPHAATVCVNEVHTSQLAPAPPSAKKDIKETSL